MKTFYFSILFLLCIVIAYGKISSMFIIHHSTTSIIKTQSLSYKPEHIYIPNLSLSLPIEESPITNGTWEISHKKTAFYGKGSSFLDEKGTTVIFAHAKKGLFATLPLLKKGSTIFVFSQNVLFVYEVDYNRLIDPTDASFLKKNITHVLSLFTCYGVKDAQRIVIFAKFRGKVNTKDSDMKSVKNNLYFL